MDFHFIFIIVMIIIFKMKGFCAGSHTTSNYEFEVISSEDSWISGTHPNIEKFKEKSFTSVSCSLHQQMVGIDLVSSDFCKE